MLPGPWGELALLGYGEPEALSCLASLDMQPWRTSKLLSPYFVVKEHPGVFPAFGPIHTARPVGGLGTELGDLGSRALAGLAGLVTLGDPGELSALVGLGFSGCLRGVGLDILTGFRGGRAEVGGEFLGREGVGVRGVGRERGGRTNWSQGYAVIESVGSGVWGKTIPKSSKRFLREERGPGDDRSKPSSAGVTMNDFPKERSAPSTSCRPPWPTSHRQ